MWRCGLGLLVAVIGLPPAHAQGVLGDVLAGKLVNPEVGQWAWYDLVDNKTHKRFLLRQAIVGEEKIGRKTGYWLEVEIVPDVGFSTVYKMLLTGPANDPKHVHRLLLRQGDDAVMEIPVDRESESAKLAESGKKSKPKRDSRGEVDIETPHGIIRAEHVLVDDGGAQIELWLNNDVRPMGIVRMRAEQGELNLRDYGAGGENALSRLYRSTSDSGRKTRVEAGVIDGPDNMREVQDQRAGTEKSES